MRFKFLTTIWEVKIYARGRSLSRVSMLLLLV